MTRLRTAGPSADDVQKVQEMERRELETSARQNPYWIGSLQTVHMLGWDAASIARRGERTASLSAAVLHDTIKKYFPLDRYVVVTLKPEVGPGARGWGLGTAGWHVRPAAAVAGLARADRMRWLTSDRRLSAGWS